MTEERIRAELSKAQAHAPSQWTRKSSRSADKEEIVVSLMQYFICPSDGDRDFNLHIVTCDIILMLYVCMHVCIYFILHETKK